MNTRNATLAWPRRRSTKLSRFQECPSPARIHRQGCSLCLGSMLHIRTLVSSEADAMMEESIGEVAKSLTSLKGFSSAPSTWKERGLVTYATVPNKTLPRRDQHLDSIVAKPTDILTSARLPSVASYILTFASPPPTQIYGTPVMGFLVQVQQQPDASPWTVTRRVRQAQTWVIADLHRRLG